MKSAEDWYLHIQNVFNLQISTSLSRREDESLEANFTETNEIIIVRSRDFEKNVRASCSNSLCSPGLDYWYP